MNNNKSNLDNYEIGNLNSKNICISGTLIALAAISCRNKLNKDTSSKMIKGIKALMFASTLSLLNPIKVEAKTNIESSIVTIEDNYEVKKVVVTTALCGTLAISAVGTAIYASKLKKNTKELYPYNLENDNVSNEEEAVKHIKIICK